MRGIVLAIGIVFLGAGCASQRAAAGSGADSLDEDGIPKNATAAERERLKRELICTTEYPTGSHIPERVCHPPNASSGGMIQFGQGAQGQTSGKPGGG